MTPHRLIVVLSTYAVVPAEVDYRYADGAVFAYCLSVWEVTIRQYCLHSAVNLSLKTLEMTHAIHVGGRAEGFNVLQLICGVWAVYRPPWSRSSFC
eukprot:scaffold29652_cov22-Cyclotella_meneghiniana.AAC.2